MEARPAFGYKAAGGSTDEARMRRVTIKLSAAHARRLLDAREQGASDQQMKEIVADGIREKYF
ncbi:hypothetical protein [Streptomyces cremeus]|uniref:Uncharacterized protein n=1 Tax=Streptomyces cremeus TaxID=66881 RepID=A0ABV5PE40_STRCM